MAQHQCYIVQICKIHSSAVDHFLTDVDSGDVAENAGKHFSHCPTPHPISRAVRSSGDRLPPQTRCISGMMSFATLISRNDRNPDLSTPWSCSRCSEAHSLSHAC